MLELLPPALMDVAAVRRVIDKVQAMNPPSSNDSLRRGSRSLESM